MWITKLFRIISRKPMYAVGFVLALSNFIVGLYLISLGLHITELAENSNAVIRIGALAFISLMFGIFQLIVGGAWLIAFFNKFKSWSLGVRRTSSLTMFFIYIFYGISGFILDRFENAAWLSSFTIAFVAAVQYLWLSVGEYHGD